ncbi:MAG: DUF4349 domain-containing protein [Anaerolineae bacterium]|jgi:hypothetical protein|nr:DUF4349 domain-containing protein [Anaerolineae bacterium]MBT4310992.1 DUF4349 domain-containing protein [Anaerolineae bacterium]MBT4459718.1 DUF4349 domain-containing protein [Anaerolineae bacterium]MBT4841852.1 DUF4349 domain-containing protein [Anaerolineae bacterium]MBT6061235.1 DUF4349 domain-containing protein [Anaerolineae bacterium]
MKRYLITIFAVLILLTGCAGAATSADYAMEESFAAAPAMEMVEVESMDDSAARSTTGSSVEAAQQERLVIKNADLSITVDDPEKKIAAISALADSMGGHVVSSNTYQSYADSGARVPEGNITIRVPSEKMDAALEQIKENAEEVNSENVSGEDVTDKYVDLQSRLKAKKAAEEKMLEIMAQATTTEETLAVYSQLQIIQSDIEVLTGQINYYERSAAMSSISVNVIATEKSKPIEIGGWKLGETASSAVQNLIDYLQGFVRFLINFIIFILPVLITLFLPFYLVFLGIRAIVRKRRAKKVAKEKVE